MSNVIVEFIKDIPELCLVFFPLVVIVVIGLVWIICYYDWIKLGKKVSFLKFAFYWWYNGFISIFGKPPKKKVKNTD